MNLVQRENDMCEQQMPKTACESSYAQLKLYLNLTYFLQYWVFIIWRHHTSFREATSCFIVYVHGRSQS